MSAKDDSEDARRYQAPYGARRPIPTISRYREARAARQQEAAHRDALADTRASPPCPLPPCPSPPPSPRQPPSASPAADAAAEPGPRDTPSPADGTPLEDTSQLRSATTDPRQRRRELKHRKRERAEREVTDPVTHLPVTIHDFTDDTLDQLGANYRATASGQPPVASRFPPPDFDVLGRNLAAVTSRGVAIGLLGAVFIAVATLIVQRLMRSDDVGQSRPGAAVRSSLSSVAFAAVAVILLVAAVCDYTARKVRAIFHDEVWDAHRRQLEARASQDEAESTAWLNSLLGSVWPLINPDLFASLCDTLEDVMQASLPRLVRMVSVEDIGQGSEALRILGIRWLPPAAAAKSVTRDGKVTSEEPCDNGVGVGAPSPDDSSGRPGSARPKSAGRSMLDGMEGQEGDFINLEVAFAYRTRSSSTSLKKRTKDMHLYLAFYLPGNLKIPVWVDLQGIVGLMRMRLQLSPDPPFFALCTVTFMGQPKVDLSCMPLSQRGLNIMDVPLISNFVQAAVDAAVAEYVAPKSLTINLKDMLAGQDFKKDTSATGVLMIHIKRGYDFKMGDIGIPFFKEGSSDPYVSVGWAKFGKILWSTRILTSEMEPYWDETCFLLVTPEELNIEERLRVQLWDSDRFTADDDLGRIEVPLKDLIQDGRSQARMWDRVDGFRALEAGNNMPGKLEWSVGYFAKARLQQCQFDRQTHDPDIRTMEQLKQFVDETSERKLREIMCKEGETERDEEELEQLKAQELKSEQDAIIISAPPPDGFPSGLLAVQIHNITGLELDRPNKGQAGDDDEASDEEETGESLPSSYCTIIVNHSKTFKTRTKPQNAKPFFNAGCERFVRDWRGCEVFISVRDARLHEDHPLIGIVHLPLGDVFKERSQVMGLWPLTGGMGHGRIRLSLVWRSVQLQVPRRLLGWSYGTVDVQPLAISQDCPDDLRRCKLKLKTNHSMGKMYPQEGGEARWEAKKGHSLGLAVSKRYSSCLSIAFKDKGFFGDKVAAFCVLWLKDVTDEEEEEVELTIWKGDFARATACCLDDCGERVGSLKLKITFWAGLGSAHSRWASRSQNLRDVVEVIDTARDNLDADELEKQAGIVDEQASSDSDSSASSATDIDLTNDSVGDRQGPLDQIRDYRRREKALHRQHRGIMQWKVPRTARWVKHRLERVGDGVTGLFDRHSKQAGIETEV